MDNYIEITRLLYLQTEVIKAIQASCRGAPASIAVFSQCNPEDGELLVKKDGAEGASTSGGEECGVDGTNGSSSEG